MAAVGFQSAGERNQVVTACAKSIAFTINRFHLADNRLTACQRSGFVKGDRFGIRKTFQVERRTRRRCLPCARLLAAAYLSAKRLIGARLPNLFFLMKAR